MSIVLPKINYMYSIAKCIYLIEIVFQNQDILYHSVEPIKEKLLDREIIWVYFYPIFHYFCDNIWLVIN